VLQRNLQSGRRSRARAPPGPPNVIIVVLEIGGGAVEQA
jgi:hypothetical protein